jgi:hypothetical protein
MPVVRPRAAIPRPMRPSRNGRTAKGRFAQGNPGGPGNPYARRVAAFRAVLLDAVTEADLKAVARSLVARAKAGEVPAIRELLDRLIGKVGDHDPETADQGPLIMKVVQDFDDPIELTAEEAARCPIMKIKTGLPDRD